MTATHLVVPRSLLRTDPDATPRFTLCADQVQSLLARFKDEGHAAFPPLVVVAEPDGRYVIADGHHRAQALELAAATEARVTILDYAGDDPVQAAYEYALRTTGTAMVRLTRAEKREALLRVLAEHESWTDVAIADLVGVSTKTVQRTRRWLADHPDGDVEAADQPAAAQRTTADDVARTLVRQLDKLWTARPFGMAVGMVDTARLGDLIAEAFIDRMGASDALTWTERLATWATRAHAHTQDVLAEETA